MMDLIKEWMAQIVSALLLISLVQHLMPQGSLQKVSALISGLVLLVVMLTPIPMIKEIDWDTKIRNYQQEFEEKKEDFALESEAVLSEEVRKQTVNVIERQAALYGYPVKAEVKTMMSGEGIPLPTEVTIQGSYQEDLSQWIASSLDIPQSHQAWMFEDETASP